MISQIFNARRVYSRLQDPGSQLDSKRSAVSCPDKFRRSKTCAAPSFLCLKKNAIFFSLHNESTRALYLRLCCGRVVLRYKRVNVDSLSFPTDLFTFFSLTEPSRRPRAVEMPVERSVTSLRHFLSGFLDHSRTFFFTFFAKRRLFKWILITLPDRKVCACFLRRGFDSSKTGAEPRKLKRLAIEKHENRKWGSSCFGAIYRSNLDLQPVNPFKWKYFMFVEQVQIKKWNHAEETLFHWRIFLRKV